MKKVIKTLSILALTICVLTGCEPAPAPQDNARQPSSITEEKKQDEPAKKDGSDDFEKKLKEAQDAQNIKERDALILTQLDITNERMSSASFLFTITNNTNYTMEAVRLEYSPVTHGEAMLEGREIGDYDVIDDEWLLHNYSYLLRGFDTGETIHLNVNFGHMARKGEQKNVIAPIETDEPKLMNFTVKALHKASDLYKNVELTNFNYDDKKGPTYTLENKSDSSVAPTVDIIYYKDGKPINMKSFNDSLEPGEKDEIEPYYSTIKNAYTFEPYEVAHDDVKTYITRK